MIVTVIAGYDIAHTPVKANVTTEPTEEVLTAPTPPQATPTPQEPQTPREYIRYKFGEHADKAFQIVECESTWNERAFNDNTTWGGVGQDRGLWQINNAYHPVSDACAYDYECATDYAHRMWIRDSKTFTRWTCGDYYNI